VNLLIGTNSVYQDGYGNTITVVSISNDKITYNAKMGAVGYTNMCTGVLHFKVLLRNLEYKLVKQDDEEML
jgi:hypothetical protein